MVLALSTGKRIVDGLIPASAVSRAVAARARSNLSSVLETTGSVIVGDVIISGVSGQVAVEIRSLVQGNVYVKQSKFESLTMDDVNGIVSIYDSEFSIVVGCVTAEVEIVNSTLNLVSITGFGDIRNGGPRSVSVYDSTFAGVFEIDAKVDLVLSESRFLATSHGTIHPAHRTSIQGTSFETKIDMFSPPDSRTMTGAMLEIGNSTFARRVNVSAEMGGVRIRDSTFKENAYFGFHVSRWGNGSINLSGVEFSKHVSFERHSCGNCPDDDDSRPEFGHLFMDETTFGSTLALELTLFQEPRKIWQVWLPESRGLNMSSDRQWAEIKHAFSRSDDIRSANELSYYAKSQPVSLTEEFQRVLWGHGFRPWRLIGWIMIVILAFGYLYWRGAEAVQSRSARGPNLERLGFAAKFTLRTAVSLRFGYANTTSTYFRIVTTVEAIVVKVMLVLLLAAFANVSPVLKQLFEGLLPG